MKSIGKKKYLLLVVVLVFILLVIIRIFSEGETYEINAENFTSAFKLISFNQEEEVRLEDLSAFIPFEWDQMLVFGPYVSEERIIEVVGYKWRKSLLTGISEGMNQVVFLDDNEVVCHIQGYPSQYGVSFGILEYSNRKDYSDYSQILNQEDIQAGLIFRDGIYYLRLLDVEEEVFDEDTFQEDKSPSDNLEVAQGNNDGKMVSIDNIVAGFMSDQEIVEVIFKSSKDYDTVFSMIEEREKIIGEKVNEIMFQNADILNMVILSEEESVYEFAASPVNYTDLQKMGDIKEDLYSYINPNNAKEVIVVKKINNSMNNKVAFIVFVQNKS